MEDLKQILYGDDKKASETLVQKVIELLNSQSSSSSNYDLDIHWTWASNSLGDK